MEKLLKIDPHVHSKGISLCSRVSCQEIIDEKIRLGYDGAVLVNHCQAWYYPAAEHAYYIERVIEEFYRGKAYADERGFRFYLGLEVTLAQPHYADWLLYGVTETFLRQTPCLYQLSQRELFALCEEAGIVLVQAHPYRAGQTPCEPQYMRGVEINATPCDLETVERVEAFAREHGLLVTCGTDYHFKEREAFYGIYLPESCTEATDIAAYLRKSGGITTFQNGIDKRYERGKIVEK